MRVNLLSLVITLLFGYSFPGEAQAKYSDTSCSISFGLDKNSFAHCNGAQRNFETVFIAVHGWMGNCRTTFGEHSSSLFSTMDSRRFYDWDCFEYDSFGLGIEENVAALTQRMANLKKHGYKHAVFITHSTGGILFLDYLMRRVIVSDGLTASVLKNAEDDLKQSLTISDAMIWAIPINGLKWNLDGVGTFFGNLFGVKQEILPELDENSDYLKELKNRLFEFNTWFSTLPDESKAVARTKLHYLHGNNEDDVVKPIEPSIARQDWLWPSGRAELIITDLPHTKNIANPTAPNAHKFPSIITNNIALLAAPYNVRFHDIFPVDAKTYPRSLEKRQKTVIQGLQYYAMENFSSALVPSLGFMDFMLSERFPRSAVVDDMLLDTLLGVFKEKFSQERHAKIALQLLEKFKNLDLTSNDALSPGHGSYSFSEKVLELIELIRRNGRSNDESWSWTDSIASLDVQKKIEITSVNLTNMILNTTAHDAIRNKALDVIHNQVQEISFPAAVESGLHDKLVLYARTKANFLPNNVKEKIGYIFISSFQRDQEFALLSLHKAESLTQYKGKNVYLWQTLENEHFPNHIANTTEQLRTIDNPDLIKLLLKANLNIARQVGARGNNSSGARKALDNVERILLEIPQLKNSVGNDFEALIQDAQINEWPGLKKRYQELTK